MSAQPMPVSQAQQVDKSRLGARFSKRAETYHKCAQVQHRIADQLIQFCQRDGNAMAPVNTNPSLPIQQTLDIGCGTGYLQRAKRVNERWVSVDLAQGMLKHARRQSATTQNSHEYLYICADAEALPFTSRQFQRVVSSMALQWVNCVPTAVAEMQRILQQQGEIFLAVLASNGLPELAAGWKHVNQAYRLNQFANASQWQTAFGMTNLQIQQHQTIAFETYHPDVLSILHSIKDIGASTLQHQEYKPLTRSTLAQLSSWWQHHHAQPEGLRLTYNVEFWHLQRSR